MTLRYGFNMHGQDKDVKKWEYKYKALSDDDKDFYNNVLCFMMMNAGIGHISVATIPELVRRETHSGILTPIDKGYVGEHELEKYLRRFIGYEVNVNTETIGEWIKRKTGNLRTGSTIKSEKVIQLERKTYIREVYGVTKETD